MLENETSTIEPQKLGSRVIRIAAFTQGRFVPSRRFRVTQLIPSLKECGVEVDEYPAKFGSYAPTSLLKRPFWFAGTILERVPELLESRNYDVTLLQRELVSTVLTLERFTGRPRLLDVDDAIWLNQRGSHNFERLVSMCDGVICGNDFIADHVANWTREFAIIPTAVNTDVYVPRSRAPDGLEKKIIIGWSGMSSGFKYLYQIEECLGRLLSRFQNVTLRILSDQRPLFRSIAQSRIEFVEWSAQTEPSSIAGMHIGVMPLDDTDWSRGKCSYKALLYMSCGIPVVVSPVGMNKRVLAHAKVGFPATSDSDWFEKLEWLINNQAEARRIGSTGRSVVEHHYSIRVLAPQLARYLKQFS